MPSRRSPGLVVVVLAASASCGFVSPTPPIFPASQAVSELDFEDVPPSRVPEGLEGDSSGRWAVADSPQAVSGTQVLVWRGEDDSLLALDGSPASGLGAEVSVRVLLGASGAGIACEGGEAGTFLFKAEPEKGRVALYRRDGGELVLVAAEKAPGAKGQWVRLGIRCEPDRVVGYVDRKAVIRTASGVRSARLALYADAGVTAQFDDLRYVAK